jgi:mono/diheme cytochrome c family protein
LGYNLMVDRRKFAAAYVGNKLRCVSCHFKGGITEGGKGGGLSLVGVGATYPKYRTREKYAADLVSRTNRTIFLQSCALCHGKNADGNGVEGKNLLIPAENLTAIRTTRPYLYRIILSGVPGTGMGYFTIYDRYQVNDLMAYLNEKYQVLAQPGDLPQAVAPQALARAEATYSTVCAACHGSDGGGSPVSRGFQPPPPDLRVYSLVPHRAFQVITQGYPGTMMPGFEELAEEVRWGLVKTVYQKRMTGD